VYTGACSILILKLVNTVVCTFKFRARAWYIAKDINTPVVPMSRWQIKFLVWSVLIATKWSEFSSWKVTSFENKTCAASPTKYGTIFYLFYSARIRCLHSLAVAVIRTQTSKNQIDEHNPGEHTMLSNLIHKLTSICSLHQVPGINEGKRRRKLAVNKDKWILFKVTRTLSIAFSLLNWLYT